MNTNTHETVPGLVPRPDDTGGVAGFAASLRALKIHVGNPSLNDLAKRSGIPRSTLADALNPRRSGVPRLAVVAAFVDACGVTLQDALVWRQAWQTVQTAQDRRRVNHLNGSRDLERGSRERRNPARRDVPNSSRPAPFRTDSLA